MTHKRAIQTRQKLLDRLPVTAEILRGSGVIADNLHHLGAVLAERKN